MPASWRAKFLADHRRVDCIDMKLPDHTAQLMSHGRLYAPRPRKHAGLPISKFADADYPPAYEAGGKHQYPGSMARAVTVP